MVWPLEAEEFVERYWQQRHFASHGPPSRLEPIFRALGVRTIEPYLERRRGEVQVWYQTQEGEQETLGATPAEALGLYRAGLTVYISQVAELGPWKAALGRQLGFEDVGGAALFGARRGAGTPWHFDRLENFTVQLRGEKTWRVAANAQVPFPLHNWVTKQPISEEMRAYVDDVLPLGAPPGRAETVVLAPGSMLYLPRGYWHTALASAGESLSVTFLFPPAPWGAWFGAALQSLLTASPRWREHAAEVLGDLRDDVSAKAKIAVLLEDLRALVARLSPEDFVPGDDPPPRLGPGSRLSRNPLAFLTVERRDGGGALVRISVRAARPRSAELELEAALAPVCAFVSRRDGPFLASEAAAAAPRVPFASVAALLRMLWQAGVLRRGERRSAARQHHLGVAEGAQPRTTRRGGVRWGAVSDLDELYQAVILDHDRAPRCWGPLAGATHRATADNPLCGDIVTLHLRIEDGAIRDVSFEGRGCSLSRAASSILATMLAGRDLASARALSAAFDAFVQAAPDAPADAPALGDLAAFAGVRRFRSRRACATLPLRALAAATSAKG